jgi:hypothetical protein
MGHVALYLLPDPYDDIVFDGYYLFAGWNIFIVVRTEINLVQKEADYPFDKTLLFFLNYYKFIIFSILNSNTIYLNLD